MNIINKIVKHEELDERLFAALNQAKEGAFWHWNRSYVLQDSDKGIHSIRLNLIQRVYGTVTGCGMGSYLKKVFTLLKITHIANENELALLCYKTYRSVFKNGNHFIANNIQQQIEAESKLWQGLEKMNLQTPNPYLNGPLDRKEWWGRFAKHCGISSGLAFLHQEILKKEEDCLAVAIGCGNSHEPFDLLERGWKVICVDYSKEVINILEKRANTINKKWLQTKQLTLFCSSIEDFQWPKNVDLVTAPSSLPYFNPQNHQKLMSSIYEALKPNAHFIGNFFCLSHIKEEALVNVVRRMGGWFFHDNDSVGYHLAAQGYDVLSCEYGGRQNPNSSVFIARKV